MFNTLNSSHARAPLGPRRVAFASAAFLAATLLNLTACSSTPKHRNAPADVAAIGQVMEAFRSAVVKKDKDAFVPLFFSGQPERITWQAVVDDASLALIRTEKPEAIKARYRASNNFMSFIDGIVNSSVAEEERFSNVHIDTDGEIASVSFDYVFLSDQQPTNSGLEKWLLVRTEQGWKITSVVYTVRLPQVSAPR